MSDSRVVDLVPVFVRRAALVLCVYGAGYWGLSPAWLLGAVFLSVLRERWRRQKKNRRQLARAIALNSEQATLAKLQDLPSWVQFPDVERVEWLNKILKQMWPYLGVYVKELLTTSWQDYLASVMANYKLSNFKFDRVQLGDIPPRIGGLKVYTDNVQRSEVIMDLEVFYPGDSRLECSFNHISAGIKDFQLHGVMRVVLKPLIGSLPLAGGVQVFFLNNPDIEFNMLGVADVLDMPGLSGLVRNAIVDALASTMVLPNKLPFVLSDQVSAKLITASQPKGMLRVQLLEARDLMRKDRSFFGGEGSSDPYGIVHIGCHKFKTKTIEETVDPVWNYVCEAMLEYVQAVKLIVDLYDYDAGPVDDDDLGRCSLDIGEIAQAGTLDLWVPLEQARSGQVHLKLDWLVLSADPAEMQKQLLEVDDLAVFENSGLHSAVLTVFVDAASDLPMASRSASEPDAFVRLSVGGRTEKTCSRLSTRDPVWEQGFSFPVANPLTQSLTVEVMDENKDRSLGSLEVDISELLEQPTLEVCDKPYRLKDSGVMSKLVLSLQLRILSHAASSGDGSATSATEELTNVFGEDGEAVSGINAVSAQNMTSTTAQPAALDVPGAGSEGQDGVQTTVDSPQATSRLRLRTRLPNPSGSSGLGRVHVNLRYIDSDGTLRVQVHKATGLPYEDDGDLPDPYIKLYLMPDRSHKQKTRTMKDSRDPEYDELLEFDIDAGSVQSSVLEVQAVSKKVFGRNPILAMTRVALGSMDRHQLLESAGCTSWLDLEPQGKYQLP